MINYKNMEYDNKKDKGESMIKSVLFSTVATALIVLGIGNYVNDWFLHGYNWLWIAIPSFWLSYKVFSRIFRVLDIVILIGIISLIVYFSCNGVSVPSL